jgi:hypothetical protein
MFIMLSELKKRDAYVSVYNDTDDADSFMFGKIDALDEEFVLLRIFTPAGAVNGLYMMPLEHIIRLEYGDPYSARMARLIGNVTGVRSGVAEPVLDSMLEYCKRGGRVASFELNDSGGTDVIGIIEDIGDETVTVRQIDLYGRTDGFTCFRIDDVSCIQYDTATETPRSRLYEMNMEEGK